MPPAAAGAAGETAGETGGASGSAMVVASLYGSGVARSPIARQLRGFARALPAARDPWRGEGGNDGRRGGTRSRVSRNATAATLGLPTGHPASGCAATICIATSRNIDSQKRIALIVSPQYPCVPTRAVRPPSTASREPAGHHAHTRITADP